MSLDPRHFAEMMASTAVKSKTRQAKKLAGSFCYPSLRSEMSG